MRSVGGNCYWKILKSTGRGKRNETKSNIWQRGRRKGLRKGDKTSMGDKRQRRSGNARKAKQWKKRGEGSLRGEKQRKDI